MLHIESNLPRVENESMGSEQMITRRRKTLMLQGMSDMSAQGLWLSAKQINPCSSGTENKATPLCCFVHPPRVPACVWHPAGPLAQQGQSSLGRFWRTARMVRVRGCTGAGWIVASTSAQKGACEGHELLGYCFWGVWKRGQLLPSFQTKGK